jgi:hypothetical protein
MRKFFTLLALAVTFLACEGDPGPPGAPITGQSFEVEVDFTPANNYEVLIQYPPGIVAFDTDRVLVYRLEEVVPGADGNPVDVWSLLPQIFYTPQGEFQYNFTSTGGDVALFLDAPDLSTLDTIDIGFVDDQIFRVAIIPVDLIAGADVSTYDLLMQAVGNNMTEIQM